ncbi:MAG: Protoheme IX farnesyltransferase 2 [Candidatus Heimdallarchaeota archaeon LC_3]|nr:MAG: Protoheme IX farnesyltransferase 2 [Candidatus Heimdallarchaeota archaeon LC_3]
MIELEKKISVEPSIQRQILPFRFHIPMDLFLNLIKAKQTLLLVYTSIFSFFISSWGSNFNWISFTLLFFGIFFAISGATLLNMFIDQDIDAVMERTMKRPLPTKQVQPRMVLTYGLAFSIIGSYLVSFINFLTMTVVFLGVFINVIVYSMLLKRKTKYSIIFGGIAGGLPAMAGRVAVINAIDPIAILLALFVVTWVPVHILTLAALPKNIVGYRKANVPMWPVVSPLEQNNRVIALSAVFSALIIIMLSFELQLTLISQIPLILLSIFLIFLSVTNLISPTSDRTFKIFKFASMFMIIAFLAIFIGIIAG